MFSLLLYAALAFTGASSTVSQSCVQHSFGLYDVWSDQSKLPYVTCAVVGKQADGSWLAQIPNGSEYTATTHDAAVTWANAQPYIPAQ